MTPSLNVALLILRVIIGLTLAGHGAQKLFGWFGGSGPGKMKQVLHSQGLKPGQFWVGLVILGELGGGLSLATGLLTPLGAAGAIGAMFMAVVKSHWSNGFWNSKRGIEFPLTLLTVSVAIGIAGPGDYSLDALFRLTLPLFVFGILVAAALIVDIFGLLISRPAATTTAESNPQKA